MRKGLLILILIILLITVVYIGTGISNFICGCNKEKETFTTTTPEASKINSYIDFINSTRPFISLMDLVTKAEMNAPFKSAAGTEERTNEETDKKAMKDLNDLIVNITKESQNTEAENEQIIIFYKTVTSITKEDIHKLMKQIFDNVDNNTIKDEEHCKIWQFLTDIGLSFNEPTKEDGTKKCVVNNKTFGETSNNNFTKDDTTNKVSTNNSEVVKLKNMIHESCIKPNDTNMCPYKDICSKGFDCNSKKSKKIINNCSKWTRDDLDKYLLKTEMTPPPDMSQYVKKDELKKLSMGNSKYVLKSELKPPSRIVPSEKYILKTELRPQNGSYNISYNNVAGGPLDMSMDYSLYPMKSRFDTCSHKNINGSTSNVKPNQGSQNDFNPSRLPGCNVKDNTNIFN